MRWYLHTKIAFAQNSMMPFIFCFQLHLWKVVLYIFYLVDFWECEIIPPSHCSLTLLLTRVNRRAFFTTFHKLFYLPLNDPGMACAVNSTIITLYFDILALNTKIFKPPFWIVWTLVSVNMNTACTWVCTCSDSKVTSTLADHIIWFRNTHLPMRGRGALCTTEEVRCLTI